VQPTAVGVSLLGHDCRAAPKAVVADGGSADLVVGLGRFNLL